jgi:hypothetical protein
MAATVETIAINRVEKQRISHLQFSNIYQITASTNQPLRQIHQNQNPVWQFGYMEPGPVEDQLRFRKPNVR